MDILQYSVRELANSSDDDYDSSDDIIIRQLCFDSSSTNADSDTDSSSEYNKPRRTLHRMKGYINVIQEYDEDEFKEHFRMKIATCNYVIDKVKENNVLPTHRFGRKKISAEEAVYMTIWYLSNLNTFREISDKFDVTRSAAHHVITVVVEYLVSVSAQYICWPNADGKRRIKANFKRLQGIDGILGAIDGTHIKIKRPNSAHSHSYCNRKGDFSIIMQAVCDTNKKFVDLFCGEAGSMHDSRVLKKSSLYEKGISGYFRNDFLLGDSAYPCLDWLISPYRDNGHLSENQKSFNYRHSSSRIVIENAFGLLKGRFRRLRMFENNNILFIVKCCVAAAVLHNICIDFDDLVDWENETDDSSDDEDYVQQVSGIHFKTSRREQLFRQMFIEE